MFEGLMSKLTNIAEPVNIIVELPNRCMRTAQCDVCHRLTCHIVT